MTDITPAAEQIPADSGSLAAYLAGRPANTYDDIEHRLAIQLGGDEDAQARAATRFIQALAANDHLNEITGWRTTLGQNIAAAQSAVTRARAAIAALTSDRIYDIEYAEGGHRVGDLDDFLDQAGRLLRAAALSNPCPPRPEGKPS